MPATAHISYWQETAGGPGSHYPPLDQDLRVDVAVLGGGITGLATAVHLKRAGRRVVVLEAAEIGSGTTGFTSGHLDATTDLPLSQMIFDFGQSAATTITTAGTARGTSTSASTARGSSRAMRRATANTDANR